MDVLVDGWYCVYSGILKDGFVDGCGVGSVDKVGWELVTDYIDDDWGFLCVC